MASDKSVGRRTLEREVSWAVFQFPRQIRENKLNELRNYAFLGRC